MTKDNGLTVKIKGQDILDMKQDINNLTSDVNKGFAEILGALKSGKGKISFNRKLVLACFAYTTLFCLTIMGLLIR